jgi:ornithine carbamoyltransferase
MDIVLAAPPEFGPDAEIFREAEIGARRHGCSVVLTEAAVEAVRGADAVYTTAHAPYRLTSELMQLASDDAVFMHCMPAHRGDEVDAEVIDGPRSIVFAQAANRLPTEQAILFDLIGERLATC